jgi:hypothetical protein
LVQIQQAIEDEEKVRAQALMMARRAKAEEQHVAHMKKMRDDWDKQMRIRSSCSRDG